MLFRSTAWKDRNMMIQYLTSKVHAKAIENVISIATGSTYGYEGDQIPSWKKAIGLW